ncbi:J domain-containing protein [Paraburkholderia sp. MMS20-SJTR3]|uniref:J domain-containing protein n=1 Tax=Paraburkholderia sejongensis TaxID=2886946 RepID=A0ABS8JRA1_9BURK|nr:J domain-containing protein [Paraburkholderia sp. MMS20-SJTR3]
MGEKIHSHYDNLKVSRDAPPEVIRAAYKTLSQKHHPDRRPDDPDAVNVMKIINGSYEVLSDPVKRRAHDEWLARKEREAATHAIPAAPPPFLDLADESYASPQAPIRPRPAPHARGARSRPGPGQKPRSTWTWTTKHSHRTRRFRFPVGPRLWIPLALLGIVGVKALVLDEAPTLDVRPTQYDPSRGATAALPAPAASNEDRKHAGTDAATHAAVSPASIEAAALAAAAAAATPAVPPARPIAPNGTAWPTEAGYIEGEAIRQNSGHWQVTVDNARNDFGVFAKLTWVDSIAHVPVRQFYIPAGASFTLSDITPGNYDIRYQDVMTGSLFKSETFNLPEQGAASEAEAAGPRITLYPAADGTARPVPIAEADF